MYFKIHRGTKEIGGSCVEVWTENTRILLDFGMPLVEKGGKEFNFNKYKALKVKELVKLGVLPDIDGLYDGSDNVIDGVVISHAHQDHYGLINYINKNVNQYIGEATHKIIEISNLFMSQKIIIANPTYFEKEIPFQIGDFTITPYWADHSAFDSYTFLVESNRKSIFYSGDFRKHGRKTNAFKWFTHNAPQNVDYLVLEGTTIGRESKPFKSETKIERELVEVFKQQGKINLIYTSGQNIDRLVSIYKACNKTGKTMVVDVYIAAILNALYPFAHIQHPSKEFMNLKVMFPYYTSKRLKETGNEKILYQFKQFKITKEEIGSQKDKIVMVVRPSMQKDLDKISGIEGGNLVYSMWDGYLVKPDTKKFIDYLKSRQFSVVNIHTSGHADTETLKQMVEAIKPKNIVPIHTFNASIYKKIFSTPVVEMNDGETMQITDSMIITKIKIEELVFHWGAEGYGAELFRIKDNGKELFVNRYSSMDIDENDNEIWRQGEVEYKSFEDYWSEFTAQKFWLHYQPIFVHKDYKLFIREFLNNEKKSWSEDEFPQRDYWLNEIVNL